MESNAKSKGLQVCEEFCLDVEVSDRIVELSDYTLMEIEELTVTLELEYFTGLVQRMVQEGYCCTQARRIVVSTDSNGMLMSWNREQEVGEATFETFNPKLEI
jgi:hypothetical protein